MPAKQTVCVFSTARLPRVCNAFSCRSVVYPAGRSSAHEHRTIINSFRGLTRPFRDENSVFRFPSTKRNNDLIIHFFMTPPRTVKADSRARETAQSNGFLGKSQKNRIITLRADEIVEKKKFKCYALRGPDTFFVFKYRKYYSTLPLFRGQRARTAPMLVAAGTHQPYTYHR